MAPDHKFQVDLRGVIDLLSNHLYSGPHVYLRELLQNAVDAIVARERIHSDVVGEIFLEVIESDGGGTLVVRDNGVGLTEEEVHEFLATIGQSSKRQSLERESFIGQFGVGLLSCFMICDEVVAITRSARGGSAVEWRGRADGTYSLRTLERDFEPGTQVYLRPRPGCEEYVETDYIRQRVAHYGSLLPYPITVAAGDERWRVNETPPWRAAYEDEDQRREALLEYGRRVFESDFLDALPLSSQAGGIEGVAFVLPHPTGLSGKRTCRVYLKNMLVSEQADNLLPDWAFFVKCAVNARDLRPTASRESFYEDERLEAARVELGQSLRRYLMRLKREDPHRLDYLIAIHHLAFKALAVEDDEFYALFAELLPFETTLGETTLGELLQRSGPLRYVASRDQFRQIASVAAAQSQSVINAGYVYDVELLEKLPEVWPEHSVERIEPSELSHDLADLSLEEREEAFEFLKLADLALQPFRCAAEMKKFAPENLPALYTANESAEFLRSVDRSKEVSDELWSGVLDRIAESPSADAYAQLCFNFRNPLVRRLAGLEDRKLAARLAQLLYVQSLLMGHYPLKSQEMKLLNEGLLGLIEQCVRFRG